MVRAHPFYFGPDQRPLFGWLHMPDAGQRKGLGVLICGPLGYESVSAYRTLRHVAEQAASHGFPALRFDYDGTGNSAGSDTDPDRMHAWLQSIQSASHALRELGGVEHVCVFGVRLGASLGVVASQELPEVVGAALISPIVDGRRYLREMRALAATSALASGSAQGATSELQEVAGFVTTSETRKALGEMKLSGGGLPVAPGHVLLVERTDLPADGLLAEALAERGSTVSRHGFAGYADMMRDAHETVVPAAMIGAWLEWMQGLPTGSNRPGAATLQDHCEFTWDASGVSGRVVERAVQFGASGTLFGIATHASSQDTADPAQPVLLLASSGSVHSVGPNRLYVQVAREMALKGIRVLRVDLPGIGDSAPADGQQENHPYPHSPMEPIADAVAFARSTLGARDVFAAGICSGAYHSFKAAVAGQALGRIVVINPLTFFWKPGMSLAQPAYQDTAEMMRYRRTGLSAASLRKLFTGKVDLANLGGILGRHFRRRAASMSRNVARSLGARLRDDLVSELRAIERQGTRLHFVFSRTDPGHALLMQDARAEVDRLLRTGTITIDFVDHADHTFTPRAAQRSLLSLLGKRLDRP